MTGIRSYRDLEVWKQGIVLAKGLYRATEKFPEHEKFGLTSQMRRASVSISSNIAEGHARGTPGEFQRFISIAMGSVAELETQIIISLEIGYFAEGTSQRLLEQLDRIGKMLRGLHLSLGKRIPRKP